MYVLENDGERQNMFLNISFSYSTCWNNLYICNRKETKVVLPLLSDSLTDDNENFGKKSLVVVTNVIVEWIEQERRPAFLLVFKGAEGGQ